MKKTEKVLGFIGILLILILGNNILKTNILFFRLLAGSGLGYTLARAYTGFAGSVNRAYRTGSTKLMRIMIFMFFMTALLVTAFLFNSDPASYNLWIKPINFGLILGGLFFGFGMSLSVCCASGVLTDLSQGFPRAFITLIFFMTGVFLGFPIQNTAAWVKKSWFISPTGLKTMGGVFLPDIFKGDGTGGYIGALLLFAFLGSIVIFLSYYYERKVRENNNYIGLEIEKIQEEKNEFNYNNFKLFSAETYNFVFIRPWSLKQGALVIMVIFTLMMGITGYGWGASAPYGIWMGKVLMFLGISSQAIANFTHMSADIFELPFFQHQTSVQNFGIVIGAIIYLLTAGKFVDAFSTEWDISFKDASIFALGGIMMGLGTRFANGCNVGALYTPIANFSLSGWVFLVSMIVGGIISNRIFFDRPLTSKKSQEQQISA